jgi:glycosyltransferase involved in cell wall biosynthesis
VKEEDKKKETPYARQINVGLEMATGKLVCYACDDIVYLPNKIEKMVNFLKRHPFVKVCFNWQKQIWEETGKVVGILAPYRVMRDPAYKVDHNSVMHYLSCIKKVGKWDTDYKYRFVADAIFWRKLGKCYPFYPIKEVLEIHYRDKTRYSFKSLKG